jgi:hypothetical protein
VFEISSCFKFIFMDFDRFGGARHTQSNHPLTRLDRLCWAKKFGEVSTVV